MPIYEYRCAKCGEVSEVLVLGKPGSVACGKCGSGDVIKLVSAPTAVGVARPKSSGSGGSCSSGSCGLPGGCCSG